MDLVNMRHCAILSLRNRATQEMHDQACSNLDEKAEYYIDAFGLEQGMEKLTEHLFQDIAQKKHPGKWSVLVSYINKISG